MLRNMTRRLALGSTLLAAAAITLLAGCTGTTPAPTTPTPSSTATAESTPTPTPDAARTATCETVLAAEGNVKVAGDGLTPAAADAFEPLTTQMVDAGALACAWGKPQTDIALTVFQVRVTPADETQWRAALAGTGYAETNDPVPGAFTGPVDPGTGVSPVAVLAGGTLTFVSAPTFATMLSPAS